MATGHAILTAPTVVASEMAFSMTLLSLLIFVDGPSRLGTPLMALAATGLLWTPARRSADYWLAAAACLLVRHVVYWQSIDNHQWLLTYWVCAIALSLRSAGPDEMLAWNGRLLIGLCFLFACLWKLSSPEFLDGSFFHFALLGGDARFDGVSRALLGMGAGDLDANRVALGRFMAGGDLRQTIALPAPSARALVLARIITAWTIFIEAAVSIVFLSPRRIGPAWLRHVLLILFVVSTYSIAPVTGFGWLLLSMGMADGGGASPRMRIAYVCAFIALPVLGLPVTTRGSP